MIVTGPQVVEWVAKQTNEYGNFGCAVGIGWESNGEIVAGVAYNEYNGPNINAHIAITGTMTKTFLWTIFDYPFNQAKVNRTTCLVGSGNAKSNNLCARLGFTEETRLKDCHPTGDMIIYVMQRENCRWLELKHELKKAA